MKALSVNFWVFVVIILMFSQLLFLTGRALREDYDRKDVVLSTFDDEVWTIVPLPPSWSEEYPVVNDEKPKTYNF